MSYQEEYYRILVEKEHRSERENSELQKARRKIEKDLERHALKYATQREPGGSSAGG